MTRALLMFAAMTAALPARAMPVFARRYKTACTTCHTLPPQLNPQGLAFRANGYRLPSGEERRQAEDVQLGAPEWEGLFPRQFLPGTLPETPPIAGMLRLALSSEAGHPRTEEIQLLAAIFTAGSLGKHASWLAEVGATNQGAGLGRMIVSVDQIGGTPWLNARVGQMEPSIVPWSRFTQRLTYNQYLAFETKVGVLELGAPKPSLEVSGAGSDPGPLRGLSYSVGLGARDDHGLTADGYGRVAYKFGGVAAAGDKSGKASAAVAPLAETSLTVGGWLYRATLGGPGFRTRGTRAGADATLRAGDFDVLAGGWAGSDDVAGGGATADGAILLPRSDSSWGALAGASARPYPWLMLMARWEATHSVAGTDRRVVCAVRGALQQNVSVTLESEIDVPSGDVGFVTGFFLAF